MKRRAGVDNMAGCTSLLFLPEDIKSEAAQPTMVNIEEFLMREHLQYLPQCHGITGNRYFEISLDIVQEKFTGRFVCSEGFQQMHQHM